MIPPSLSNPNGLSLPSAACSSLQDVLRAPPQFPPSSLRQLQFTPPPQGYMGNTLHKAIISRKPFDEVSVPSGIFKACVHGFTSSHAGQFLSISECCCPIPILDRGIGHTAAAAKRNGRHLSTPTQCINEHFEKCESLSPL